MPSGPRYRQSVQIAGIAGKLQLTAPRRPCIGNRLRNRRRQMQLPLPAPGWVVGDRLPEQVGLAQVADAG
jgi:hypothetical protein